MGGRRESLRGSRWLPPGPPPEIRGPGVPQSRLGPLGVPLFSVLFSLFFDVFLNVFFLSYSFFFREGWGGGLVGVFPQVETQI